jgi:hypothetical protein
VVLTHEQAGLIRIILSSKSEFGTGDLEATLIALLPPEVVHHELPRSFLNNKARRQLAEYDAKYVVVERAEHRRLTLIKNKVEEFLDCSMIGNKQIELGEEGGLREASRIFCEQYGVAHVDSTPKDDHDQA